MTEQWGTEEFKVASHKEAAERLEEIISAFAESDFKNKPSNYELSVSDELLKGKFTKISFGKQVTRIVGKRKYFCN